MEIERRNSLLLCVIQILSILGWDGGIAVYLFYIEQTYLNIDPFVYLFLPPVIATGASFVFTLLYPVKRNYKKAILLSTPATFIYFGYYVIRPLLISRRVEAIVILCSSLVLPTVLVLVTISFAVWLGSSLHARIFKREEEHNDRSRSDEDLP